MEFTIEESHGRRNATNVTGPDGTYVQGKTLRPRREYDGDVTGMDRY